MGEARSRIEKNGFANVGDLTKDDNGVWRGLELPLITPSEISPPPLMPPCP
jgi:hypothetical protein